MKNRFSLSRIVGAILDAAFTPVPRRRLMLGGADVAELEAGLAKIADNVKAIGEKAMDEVKKLGGMTEKTKGEVDALLTANGETAQKLKDLQQEVVAMRDARSAIDTARKTAGELFVEADSFKDQVTRAKSTKGRSGVSVEIERKAVTSATGSAGPGVAPDFRGDIISLGRRQFTIRDLMLPGSTNGNAVTYVRELGFTNAAAPVSETIRKPESTLTLEAITQPVITIASFMKASVQILDDIPQLQSYIDGRLRYGLKYAEELQLLKGSGTGQNLNGIYTQATAYSAPSGSAVTAETTIDRIRLMMLQVFLAEFPATGIVLHPTNWANIELMKDGENRYLIGMATEVLGPRLWGLPVVETQAMTVDTGLVGAFRPMSQIFDRETMNVVIATENEDDFVKNLITIRCEERLASAVYRPEAFVKATDMTP